MAIPRGAKYSMCFLFADNNKQVIKKPGIKPGFYVFNFILLLLFFKLQHISVNAVSQPGWWRAVFKYMA